MSEENLATNISVMSIQGRGTSIPKYTEENTAFTMSTRERRT